MTDEVAVAVDPKAAKKAKHEAHAVALAEKGVTFAVIPNSTKFWPTEEEAVANANMPNGVVVRSKPAAHVA